MPAPTGDATARGAPGRRRGRPLRVCIDARMMSGAGGGVQQFTLGLASGLSSLTDGAEEYVFLTHGDDDWLTPHLGGPCTVLRCREPLAEWARRKVTVGAPILAHAWNRVAPALPSFGATVPASDGTIERAGADLMHFTFPNAFRTRVPSIYQPWDLQHLHLPDFFPERTRRTRAAWYPAFCAQADAVVAPSEWVKNDLAATLGVDPGKIVVINPAAPTDVYGTPTVGDLQTTRAKLRLPGAFLLYPAQTWRHKNHLALFEAIALLRDRRSLTVPVVCTGHRNSFFPGIERRLNALGLESLVRFVGFVEPLELRALYELCRGLVFPSLFEGWGLPLTEAFSCGVPIACAAVTCLPEVVGDAALLFDPLQPEAIAAGVERLWTDERLRARLIERGHRRVAELSWRRVAEEFRALYRSVAQPAASS